MTHDRYHKNEQLINIAFKFENTGKLLVLLGLNLFYSNIIIMGL